MTNFCRLLPQTESPVLSKYSISSDLDISRTYCMAQFKHIQYFKLDRYRLFPKLSSNVTKECGSGLTCCATVS